jgi:hypothetical protein
MAQHSHFHLPRGSVPRTGQCSRRKQRLHCNLPVGLVEEHCLEAEEKWLDCTLSDWVGERIDHQGERIGAVPYTGWAFHRVVEGTQGLVGSTLAHHRGLQALRQRLEEREHMGPDRKHLRKDHVLHFPQRLSTS